MAFGEVSKNTSFDTGVMAGAIECWYCEIGDGCIIVDDCTTYTDRGKLVCDDSYNCKSSEVKCEAYGGADGGHCEWN